MGGGTESMKILEYTEKYISYINNILVNRFEKIFLINTPIVSKDLKLDRIRPKSFFEQLMVTNDLIENFLKLDKKYELINIKSINKTFDAVHFIKEGHLDIFFRIKKELNL